MTAAAYLSKMEDKYYWRVFGPTEECEFRSTFDLNEEWTWPQFDGYEMKNGYVRYGSIKVVGTASIIGAELGPTRLDLRGIDVRDTRCQYFHWQSGERKQLFRKMGKACMVPFPAVFTAGHRTLTPKWKFDGEKV